MVNSEPENGQDCYCHKSLSLPIYVNGTEIDNYYPNVQEGKSFTLRVEVHFDQNSSGIATASIAWLPNTADNSKFTFDPAQVVDNSPQDQNPTPGVIVALFKITAPNQTGSYSLMLSYLGDLTH